MANNLYDYKRSDEPTELNNNSISNPQQYQVLERKQRIYRNDLIQAETNNDSIRPTLDLGPKKMTHKEERVKKEEKYEEAKRDNIPYSSFNSSKPKKLPVNNKLPINSSPFFATYKNQQETRRNILDKERRKNMDRIKVLRLKQKLQAAAKLEQLKRSNKIKNQQLNEGKYLKTKQLKLLAIRMYIKEQQKKQQNTQQNTSSRTFKH